MSSTKVENGIHSKVDVLIVGAGPAGAMLANWLSRFHSQGITTRIIDRRPDELTSGQADGLMARTLEVFEHMGILPEIHRECQPVSEMRFWSPNQKTGILCRTGVMPQDVPGDSRFISSILHQNRIEHHLNTSTSQHSESSIQVERGVFPESLSIDKSIADDPSKYPITVQLRHFIKTPGYKRDPLNESKCGMFRSTLLTAEEQDALHRQGLDLGRREVISAKYVVGCDGAHSWVRRHLGISMIGEQTNYVWGVIEGVFQTNFPDIRVRAVITSAKHGTMMVIPQERGCTRLYIQLPMQVEPGAYLDRSAITSESILESAQKIVAPYYLDLPQVEWYTGYPIGQRVTESFAVDNRVFLAGDACHTHSPKAGQGMNVSMQDTYNLGWKLGLVVAGKANPDILQTYTGERKMVAHELIEFDYQLAHRFSSAPKENVDPGLALQRMLSSANRFGSGMLIKYPDTTLVRRDLSRPHLAKCLFVGERFFSAQVVNVASANATQLVQNMPADGAFRVLVFAGRVAEAKPMERLRKLAAYFDEDGSVVSRYTSSKRPRDSVIDVLTIHSSPRLDVELYDFPQPSILLPHNYNKIFCDEPSHHRGDGKAYETFGINKDEGAIVVVRPDHYVGMIIGLDDKDRLHAYFEKFLLPVAHPHTAAKISPIAPLECR